MTSSLAAAGCGEGGDGAGAGGTGAGAGAEAGASGGGSATGGPSSGGALGTGGGAGGTGGNGAGGSSSGGGSGVPTGPVAIVDGTLTIGGKPFVIQGVDYNPVTKGATHPGGIDFPGFVEADAALMQAAGINTIRTYVALTDTDVLDTLHAAGIFVINGLYQYGGTAAADVVPLVEAVKDHPAILMWSIGNEWNYNGLYVGMSHADSLARLNEVAALIREADAAHPITCIYGEIPSAETTQAMPLVDVWGINAYRGISFGPTFFDDYRAVSDKPMFLAEYGADAYNANLPGPDPEAQADATRALTEEILAETSDGVLGGTIFEWSDEWWKDGEGALDAHDVGGIAPGGGPHPDATFNEEWWGIVDIDRTPRPAYYELQDLYVN